MTEETKDVVKTTSQEAMSSEDQVIMEQLRAGSGEAEQGGGYTFIPYLTINNEKVTAKLEGGGEAEVLCQPMFLLNEKDGDEYVSKPFVKEFRAVVLAVRHYAQRKYLRGADGKEANELSFYKTIEFKSFSSAVHVRMNKEFLPPMTYQEVKSMSPEGKENELWGVAYVLVEGEETVRKVEVKGASRGVLFDYITAKKERSVSTYITNFTQVVEKGEGFSYNMLELENTGETPKDLAGILKAQTALNVILDGQETPSTQAVQGAVVTDADIKLDDTKANMEAINGGQSVADVDPTPEQQADDNGLSKMFT